MYFFELNMSTVKSEALVQQCSKNKGRSFLKLKCKLNAQNQTFTFALPGTSIFQCNLQNLYK